MSKIRLLVSVLLSVLASYPAAGDELQEPDDLLRQSIQLMKSPDPRLRERGALALATTEKTNADAIDALGIVLTDKDSNVAVRAATSLGQIGGPAISVLPRMITALDNENEHIRYATAWALSKIMHDLETENVSCSLEQFDEYLEQLGTAVDSLRKRGEKLSADLVSDAIVMFQDFAPPEPPSPAQAARKPLEPTATVKQPTRSDDNTILSDLNSDDPITRVQAAYRLEKLGVEGVPIMFEALRIVERRNAEGTQGDDFVVLWPTVQRALERIGAPAAPMLAEALTDPAIMYTASDALDQLGPNARVAVPKLVELLKIEQIDSESQALAATALGSIGSAAKAGVGPLIRILRDETSKDDPRVAAATALGQIGKASEPAVAHLISLTENRLDSDRVRSAAATALGNIGAPLKEILPALIALLEDETELDFVRASAAHALVALGDEARPALPAILRMLQHDDIYETNQIVRCLTEMESIPETATASILQVLDREDADEDTVMLVADAVKTIGPVAITELVKRLDVPEEHIRARAAEVIAHIGPFASEAVAPLIKILHGDQDSMDRRFAVIALGEIGTKSTPAFEALLGLFKSTDEDPQMRAMAVTALGGFGKLARKAEPELMEAAHDNEESVEVRCACILALAEASPDATPELLKALESDVSPVRLAAARGLYLADVAKKRALPTLLSALQDGDAGYIAAEVIHMIGDRATEHLCQVILDKDIDLETRRTAIRMLSEHFMLGAMEDEVASTLVQAMHEKQLRDDAEMALFGVAPAAIPLLLRELELEQLENGKTSRHEQLSDLVLSLCVPLGGGAGGEFYEETGFKKYDQLGLYAHQPMRAARLPMMMMEEGAMAEEKMFPEAAMVPEKAAEAVTEPEKPIAAVEEEQSDKAGFETVKVFYGTNRRPETFAIAVASPSAFGRLIPAAIAGFVTMLFGIFCFVASRARFHAVVTAAGMLVTAVLAYNSTSTTPTTQQEVRTTELKYGATHSDVLDVGTCEVTIPAIHQTGELESPSVLRLEFHEDPLKHVVLKEISRYEPERFFDELREDLKKDEDSILVFVHGYNVAFQDAARRTAQMSYDLDFKGVPMFYSWPSQANWYQYREDEKNVELAVPHIKKFLLDIVQRSGASSIHLIAHSMGNRALTGALREIAQEAGQQKAMFNQVVLAAPDINADIFTKTIAPAITKNAQRVTLYASANDLALTASQTFNAGGPRAGDTSAGPVIVPGIETIDVTAADSSLLGHSYYGSSASVLDDLRLLLMAATPDQRPQLSLVAERDRAYWVYGHPETAVRTTTSTVTPY